MKSLKEKWLSMVQLVREKGENGMGGSSTVTGMIAGRNELLGSANWLLDRCLNLCLVDPFQSFLFIFLIEGGETLGTILEHETGAGTPKELYRALLPIYRWIVLLQSHVAQDERVPPEVGNFSTKFLPVSEEVDCEVDGMCYISCRVVGAVHVKDTNRVCEGFLLRSLRNLISSSAHSSVVRRHVEF